MPASASVPPRRLAEALLAADRGEPHIRHDTDAAVDERGDERVDVPPFVSGRPETVRDGRDLGRPEQIIERDRKSLGHCADGEETWLDSSLALQTAQRSDGDACFLGQPFPRPPPVLPQRPYPLGERTGVVVGRR